MLTCVSGYYQIKNKHDDKYLKWFKTSLQINAPYVIFGTKETIEIMRPFRDGLPTVFIERNIEDFECGKYETKMWTDPLHCPSIDLNKMWNEKIFMVRDASRLNPFNTEWFAWVDAGICIYRDVAPPKKQLCVNNLSKDKFNCSDHEPHQVTGTYVLYKDIIEDFAIWYESVLIESKIIKTDQIVLSLMYLTNSSKFNRVCSGYGTILIFLYELSEIIPTYIRLHGDKPAQQMHHLKKITFY